MALKMCTTALDQGGYHANVGDVVDSTSYVATRYSSFFTDISTITTTGAVAIAGANTFKRPIVNTGGVYATPIALTEVQSGTTFLVNDAAGLDFTLPAVAAAQVGTFYRFVVTVTVSSNNFRVTAASGDFLNGSVWIADFDTANTGAYFTADGTSHLVMTMNGGTKGGKKGTVVEFEAISATGWMVTGVQVFGDGVLATPFS